MGSLRKALQSWVYTQLNQETRKAFPQQLASNRKLLHTVPRYTTIGTASHPVGCHAQIVQSPSNALLPELGQASLAVTLAGSPVTSRIASQAHPVLPGGRLTLSLDICYEHLFLFSNESIECSHRLFVHVITLGI
jgi:hypothetical protein